MFLQRGVRLSGAYSTYSFMRKPTNKRPQSCSVAAHHINLYNLPLSARYIKHSNCVGLDSQVALAYRLKDLRRKTRDIRERWQKIKGVIEKEGMHRWVLSEKKKWLTSIFMTQEAGGRGGGNRVKDYVRKRWIFHQHCEGLLHKDSWCGKSEKRSNNVLTVHQPYKVIPLRQYF